jgi:hypothetical protein
MKAKVGEGKPHAVRAPPRRSRGRPELDVAPEESEAELDAGRGVGEDALWAVPVSHGVWWFTCTSPRTLHPRLLVAHAAKVITPHCRAPWDTRQGPARRASAAGWMGPGAERAARRPAPCGPEPLLPRRRPAPGARCWYAQLRSCLESHERALTSRE